MDVYNSLISRRSVSRFLPKEVDQSKIKKILEGAALHQVAIIFNLGMYML